MKKTKIQLAVRLFSLVAFGVTVTTFNPVSFDSMQSFNDIAKSIQSTQAMNPDYALLTQ